MLDEFSLGGRFVRDKLQNHSVDAVAYREVATGNFARALCTKRFPQHVRTYQLPQHIRTTKRDGFAGLGDGGPMN
jgi:hypothetical protein